VVLASVIAPLEIQRADLRHAFPKYLEVFMDTPLETCRRRDPKGLYRKAYAGLLPGFTGVGSPYQRPLSADIVVKGEVPSDEAARLLCSKIL
jgi:bifunctional enzyme CysN/CysC